jgi:hypothetical protein
LNIGAALLFILIAVKLRNVAALTRGSLEVLAGSALALLPLGAAVAGAAGRVGLEPAASSGTTARCLSGLLCGQSGGFHHYNYRLIFICLFINSRLLCVNYI